LVQELRGVLGEHGWPGQLPPALRVLSGRPRTSGAPPIRNDVV
jgi:hypothetical protein